MKIFRQFLDRPWLYLVIVIIGIALKFNSIESKFFWYDEIETIMHVSGISDLDYPSHVPVNEVKNIRYYHDLMHLNKQDYTIGSQLKGLFSMPQLTPLHPALLIFWVKIVGDDYIHYRLFNVFLLIVILPFLFLLCKKLFGSNLAGWVAISLFSVSPFFNIFTQEARYIMLWGFFTILCHYSFLTAIEKNNLKWWVIYSLVAVLAMYTSLLSALVLFGHLVYIFIRHKNLRIKYSIVLFAVVLFYLPWMITMYANRAEILRSMYWQKFNGEITVLQQFPGQLFGMTTLFTYFAQYPFTIFRGVLPDHLILTAASVICILALIILAFVYFIRKSSSDIKYFLSAITIPSILFIAIIDIIRNGWVSFIWRYHIIGFIGVLLIVANYLSAKIKENKNLFVGIFFSLVIIAFFSILKVEKIKCPTIGVPCEKWDNYMIAEKLENSGSVLIITDFSYWAGMGGFLEVMAKVKNENLDVLYTKPNNDAIKKLIDWSAYSNIFLVHVSDQLLQNLQSNVTSDIVPVNYGETIFGTPMWRIRNN